MPFSDKLRVSVVIPVHDGGEKFRQCLSAVTRAEPRPHEIIVVVDGAADGSGQLAETFGVRVMRTSTRSGPARARNLGARAAGGDILFFVDADVLVRPDAVGQVAAIFDQDPGLAAVFGSYDDAPAATNFLSQYRNLLHHYVHQMSREEASTFFGACGAIRRDVFLELGGYDKCYREPAIEDDGVVFRQSKAYPVYDRQYRKSLEMLRRFLATIENLQTNGRNGMHRYNNLDHSMLTGMLAVGNLLGGDHDLWQVNTESSYHEQAPPSWSV